jgi:hypothetical protein
MKGLTQQQVCRFGVWPAHFERVLFEPFWRPDSCRDLPIQVPYFLRQDRHSLANPFAAVGHPDALRFVLPGLLQAGEKVAAWHHQQPALL